MGYKLAVYLLVLMASAVRAMQQALVALVRGEMPEGASFEAIKNLVGFTGYYELEQRYRSED